MNVIQSSGAASNPLGLPLYGFMTDQPDADGRIFCSGIVFSDDPNNPIPPQSVTGFIDIDHANDLDKFFTGLSALTVPVPDGNGGVRIQERVVIKGNGLVSLGDDRKRNDGVTSIPFGVGYDEEYGDDLVIICGGARIQFTPDLDDPSGDGDTLRIFKNNQEVTL